MRLFLSYGHDGNAELVDCIKADLERRGHDVWFDKSEIHFGDDWRRAITDGIIRSNRVLSFLSKYSARDPGVCLDELAIAIGYKGANIQTILVESETEVKPPPSIGHIQWLDMHNWKEERAKGDAAWEAWYRAKLAEIVRVVESDQSRKFAGEIESLSSLLKPISSESRIAELLKKPLVGRTWLFDAVEQWRNAPDRSSRLFWITGAPGVGKSAFAAHLAHFGRDKVIAVQFIEYDKPDHRNPQRIVRTLAFQLATRLPDFRKLLLALPEINELDRKNPAELFDYLLANPLKLSISGGRERYLIIIDALDEAGGSGHNELVEMLARNAPRLPEWIGIVATSRPESDVVTPLQGLNPCMLDTSTESNRADIREYLRRELAQQLAARADGSRLVEQILGKSEGMFLYAERFASDVQQGHLSLDRPDQFPQGLGGVFYQYFQRQFPDLEKYRKDVRPALRAILAAREPLPVGILQQLFNWQQEELNDFILALGSLFSISNEPGHQAIKAYHKSITDWLTDQPKAAAYFVSVLDGHRLLSQFGESHVLDLAGPVSLQGIDGFWARCTLYHCVKSQDWNRLVNCIDRQAIFWKFMPPDCVIGYYRYDLFGMEVNELIEQELTQIPRELQPTVCWRLASALGERAVDLQSRAFAIAKEHQQGTNLIRKYLEHNDPVEFDKLRHAVYSFAELAGISAQFAFAAISSGTNHQHEVQVFLDRFSGKVGSYLHYLSNFACTEGWSGALENVAWEAYIPWDRLYKLVMPKPQERGA